MFSFKHDTVSHASSSIHVDNVREDRPEFKRIYTARVNERATVKISMRSWSLGGRSSSGELTQPNGRWVLFDPNAIADKILDRELVPLIQSLVDEIFKIDKQFMKSDPDEFLDESGDRWVRAPE